MPPGPIEVTADDAKKVGAGAVGGAVAQASGGLERAAQAAGDVLRGIFGGLPWQMDPTSIVDAVGTLGVALL